MADAAHGNEGNGTGTRLGTASGEGEAGKSTDPPSQSRSCNQFEKMLSKSTLTMTQGMLAGLRRATHSLTNVTQCQ